ncbi:MAG TPA: hypothetical protein EYP67_01080 [Methanosarcinales archaeon]|nr:hypothetical protein [Methanosarcinales archaeon]
MSETNERVRKLIKRIYALGYNVGYHHHSEIGWVSDTYNTLAGQADDAELRDLLREYYKKGKEDGRERRKRDIQGRNRDKIGKYATDQNEAVIRDYEHTAKNIEPDQTSERSEYEIALQFSAADMLLQQPLLLSMPSNITRTALINPPVNLEGLRMILTDL